MIMLSRDNILRLRNASLFIFTIRVRTYRQEDKFTQSAHERRVGPRQELVCHTARATFRTVDLFDAVAKPPPLRCVPLSLLPSVKDPRVSRLRA